MPLKPHPTNPDKMVLVRGEYILPKEWVGLTKEEIAILWKATPLLVGVYSYTAIALEVQAKLKEKNGG